MNEKITDYSSFHFLKNISLVHTYKLIRENEIFGAISFENQNNDSYILHFLFLNGKFYPQKVFHKLRKTCSLCNHSHLNPTLDDCLFFNEDIIDDLFNFLMTHNSLRLRLLFKTEFKHK